MPTIVISGGETFYLLLTESLPRSVCKLVYCDSIQQTLDRAVDADLIVVDTGVPGTGHELCRQLRENSETSNIPLILRAPRNKHSEFADHCLPPEDPARTIRVMHHLCPRLANPPVEGVEPHPGEIEGRESPTFDVEQNTEVWRRNGTNHDSVDHWPFAPPSRGSEEDILHFVETYAGYVNSLLEGFQKLSKLASGELKRLYFYSRQVVEHMDYQLNLTQKAVNEALRSGDLARMKELTSARNTMYEKLHRLRNEVNKIVGDQQDDEIKTSELQMNSLTESTGPMPRASDRALGHEDIPTSEASISGPHQEKNIAKKSELTLAAEKLVTERAKKRAETEKLRRKTIEQQQLKKSGSAKMNQSQTLGSIWLWLGIAVICVSVFVVLLALRTGKPQVEKQAPSQNNPPRMIGVSLKQTPGGIVAYPRAEDPDNDSISFAVRWILNGNPVANARTAHLSPKSYQNGDSIEVEVVPSDGYARGQPMRSQPIEAKTTPNKQQPTPTATPDSEI
ncbi:MAG: hypothetical protein V1754_10020 [Pseudomonadota bacterium]